MEININRENNFLFMAGGAVIIVASLIWLFMQLSFIVKSTITVGRVTSVRESQSGSSSSRRRSYRYRYHMNIAYEAAGKTYNINGSKGSDVRNVYRIGTELKVRYNLQNPSQATIDSVFDILVFPFSLLMLGVMTTGAALSVHAQNSEK